MRSIYIAIVVAIVVSILLLIATFVYLEREKHQTYYYTVRVEDTPYGSLRVDRYVTEDKRIYKGVSQTPFSEDLTDSEERLTLSNQGELDEYREESSGMGAVEFNLIKNDKGVVSFLSSYGSRFAYLKSMPTKEDSFLLKDESLVTYMPLVEGYDFKKGRAQGFRTILYFDNALPPMKIVLTLTSIRDEYIKIDGWRVKTECILVRARGHPQITVWVSKADHSIVMVDVHSKHLRFSRTFSPKEFAAKKGPAKRLPETGQAVVFKSKRITLSGVLSMPQSEGACVPVLMIPDSGVADRDCLGIFSAIADRLVENGYAVLRWDRRGIGASQGDYGTSSDEDEEGDIRAAIDFLSTQKNVDSEKIVLLGYSKGGYFASKIASENPRVKGCIIMAGLAYTNGAVSDFQMLRTRASRENWPEDYLALVLQSRLQSLEIVNNRERSSQTILGRRCYLQKMREELNERPLEVIKGVKVPVLLLHGSNDDQVPSEYSKMLDKSLEEAGNSQRTLMYFGYLDHYFGKKEFNGKSKVAYIPDPQVLDTIVQWLKNNVGMLSVPAAPLPQGDETAAGERP